MIKSFRHKGLELFYTAGTVKGIQPEHKDKLAVILNRLNNLESLSDINFPGAGLHRLKGNMQGLWAVTVRANWRITFKYDENTNDVYIVDYQDYH